LSNKLCFEWCHLEPTKQDDGELNTSLWMQLDEKGDFIYKVMGPLDPRELNLGDKHRISSVN